MKSILANKLGKYQTTFNSAVDTLTKLGALSHSTDPTQLVEAVDEIVRKYIIFEHLFESILYSKNILCSFNLKISLFQSIQLPFRWNKGIHIF